MVQFPWWGHAPLGVAEILELCQQCSVEDINTSTLLVGHMMTERKECSQDHLEIQLQREKDSSLLMLQGINVGCCHVNEGHLELGNTIASQSKCDGTGSAMGMRHSTNIDEGSPQTILFSFLLLDAAPVVPLIVLELNCDKC